MKVIKKIVIFTAFLFFSANRAFAYLVDPPVKGNLADLIKKIWHYLYWISFPIATLMIIIAGFMFVTAGGNQNQIKKGKDIILYTAVGFLVIILASGVVSFIEGQF